VTAMMRSMDGSIAYDRRATPPPSRTDRETLRADPTHAEAPGEASTGQ
jgi:hypothetical protein